MPTRSTKSLQGHPDTHKVALPRQGQGERETNKSNTLDGKKFRLSLVPARSGFSPHSHNYTQKVAITYSRQGQTHVRSRALRVGVNTVPKISLVFTQIPFPNNSYNEAKRRPDPYNAESSQEITQEAAHHTEKRANISMERRVWT